MVRLRGHEYPWRRQAYNCRGRFPPAVGDLPAAQRRYKRYRADRGTLDRLHHMLRRSHLSLRYLYAAVTGRDPRQVRSEARVRLVVLARVCTWASKALCCTRRALCKPSTSDSAFNPIPPSYRTGTTRGRANLAGSCYRPGLLRCLCVVASHRPLHRIQLHAGPPISWLLGRCGYTDLPSPAGSPNASWSSRPLRSVWRRPVVRKPEQSSGPEPASRRMGDG